MSGTSVVVCVTVSTLTQQQRVLAASFVKPDTRLSRGQLLGSLINRDKITSHAAPTPLRPSSKSDVTIRRFGSFSRRKWFLGRRRRDPERIKQRRSIGASDASKRNQQIEATNFRESRSNLQQGQGRCTRELARRTRRPNGL